MYLDSNSKTSVDNVRKNIFKFQRYLMKHIFHTRLLIQIKMIHSNMLQRKA